MDVIGENNLVPEKTWIHMAIVLCSGSPEAKATEIFEYYDRDVNRRLSLEEMKLGFAE